MKLGVDFLDALTSLPSLDMIVMMMNKYHKKSIKVALMKIYGENRSKDSDAHAAANKLGCPFQKNYCVGRIQLLQCERKRRKLNLLMPLL